MNTTLRRVCVVCKKPQFKSPSGWVCDNGHGGADFELKPVPDYTIQYKNWTEKIKKEINS